MKLIDILENKCISEGLQYHIDNNKPISDNIYRPDSDSFFKLFKEARIALNEGLISNLSENDMFLLNETDIGEMAVYNGYKVPLDYPMSNEYLHSILESKNDNKPLNKPKRSSGPKKYVVYVRNPKTKKIKKINFGDVKGGLSAKLNDPKARKSFSARHNCPMKKDKMAAGYWACRLTRYANINNGKTYSGYW